MTAKKDTPPPSNSAAVSGSDRCLVRLCSECRHAKWSRCDSAYRCHRNMSMTKPDPVDGKSYETGSRLCRMERTTGIISAMLFGKCGKRARFFEPNVKADSTANQ